MRIMRKQVTCISTKRNNDNQTIHIKHEKIKNMSLSCSLPKPQTASCVQVCICPSNVCIHQVLPYILLSIPFTLAFTPHSPMASLAVLATKEARHAFQPNSPFSYNNSFFSDAKQPQRLKIQPILYRLHILFLWKPPCNAPLCGWVTLNSSNSDMYENVSKKRNALTSSRKGNSF